MNIRRLFHKISRLKPKTASPDAADHPSESGDLSGDGNPEQTCRRPAIRPAKSDVSGMTQATEVTKIRRQRERAALDQWIFTVSSGVDRGRQFVGVTDEIRLGRQPENHIQLRDPKVSRFHAVIRRKGTQLYLEDLKSTNGTFLNGQPLASRKRLEPGDTIKLGQTVIEVGRE
jgi:pSer/pThr/pTyr-binding forkhead associated (FHA) protein